MMQARGTNLPELARELGIARSVLADLVSGGMRAPVGERLADALMHSLAVTGDALESAVQAALRAPRLGHAKADGTPSLAPRSYAEIIEESAMSPERKRYWLGED
jgi:transcriptional regulator with XRE-family HTH domain